MGRWRSAAALLIGLGLLPGCGGPAAGPASGGGGAGSGQAPPILIGAAISFSGPTSNEGQTMVNGYKLWADTVDAQGGIDVGGKRRLVKLELLDDKSTPSTAGDLVEKLITRDRVDFLFGPYGSGVTSVASAASEKYHKLMIAPLANADPVYQRGFQYLFGILPPASRGVPPELDALKAAAGDRVKKVAIVYPDDLFPTVAAKAVDAHARELGYDVVYFNKYPKDTRDLTPILTQVKAAGAQVLLTTGYVQDSILIVRQSRQLRLGLSFLGLNDMPFDASAVQELGSEADGIVGQNWWTPGAGWKGSVDFSSSEDYAQRFRAKYHQPPNNFDAASAAAGVVLQMAIEKAGTTDTDKVAAALRSQSFNTFFGNIHFGANGANDNGSSVLGQIEGGKLVIVWPEAIRSQPLVFPAISES